MSKEFVAGKRYPRGLTRRRNIKDRGKLSCSYFDMGQVPLNTRENEYKRRLAEFKKMANVS